MDAWFCGFTNLKTIAGLENVKFATDEVSFFSTFDGCINLEKIDLTPLGDIYINGGSRAFYGCQNVTEIDMSNILDIKNNENDSIGKSPFRNMFSNCANLETIYVSETLQMYDSVNAEAAA